jgi:predicted nucleic acid-binding protein
MKTALDTSVILDVITDNPVHAEASAHAVREAMAKGQLVISECVLAEITPAFSDQALTEFLADWKVLFSPSDRESAIYAGRMFGSYLARGQEHRRVLPDFLIASHALHHADCLLARDRGYYRDYFKDLKLIYPGIN